MSGIFAGLVKGVSEGVSEGHERRRQKMEERMQEARELAKVAKSRGAKAQEISRQIEAANSRFGVSKGVLYDAYKAGTLEDYLGLLDKAGDISPQQREGLWKVPKDKLVTGEEDYYTEIKRAMGVLDQGVSNLPEANDMTIGSMLYDMMGGSNPETIKRSLTGQTVQGYDVGTLLDMPDPEGLGLPSGNWDYSMRDQIEERERAKGRTPKAPKERDPLFDNDIRQAFNNQAPKALRQMAVALKGVLPEDLPALEAEMYSILQQRYAEGRLEKSDFAGPEIYEEVAREILSGGSSVPDVGREGETVIDFPDEEEAVAPVMGKVDAATRARQLRAEGKTKEETLEILKQEGYGE